MSHDAAPHPPLSREALRAATFAPEAELAPILLDAARLDEAAAARASAVAEGLITRIRAGGKGIAGGATDALMREYDLSNDEGTTLMELAEALLRIPDAGTRDRLIRDKIGEADWGRHAGSSPSFLVNMVTAGLGLGARMVEGEGWLAKTARRAGTPILRGSVVRAMEVLGDRFVFASSIASGIGAAETICRRNELARFSFDMLGEGARTPDDAERYRLAYAEAIAALAEGQDRRRRDTAPGRLGISVKLSAIDPRYETGRAALLHETLMPRLLGLARQAAAANIPFTIDAEEAHRLDLSLDFIEYLALHPDLRGWNGLGLAVQAYGRRALPLVDWLEALARKAQRRLEVRLVKGAYWDSEIKRAQQEGLPTYPVFTRKETTDLSYLAAARKLLAAGSALYPMFATHNAFTVAAIREMAGPPPVETEIETRYEFQRLHGMGDALYKLTADWRVPCRVYAPVGPHRDLLAYLVRRLLENGANSSFVSRIADPAIAPAALAASPTGIVREQIETNAVENPRLPAPTALYPHRLGAPGYDSGDPTILAGLESLPGNLDPVTALPLIGRHAIEGRAVRPVLSAVDGRTLVGTVAEAGIEDVAQAAKLAEAAYHGWSARPVEERATVLERAAGLMEEERDRLLALLVREAGRTLRNAVGEWREAVDFLRFYAAEARRLMQPHALPGPTGESNRLRLVGKGVFACISPWNFPLSIFTGQVAAALAAGNAVLAKPAPETPLIAYEMIRLLHRAGVPADVLHYLPGGAEIGTAVVSQAEISGVVFTGSTGTARRIAQALAAKDGPLATLIAETAGQNAMIVDSSALLEQSVDDIMVSAFDSAGQRCSSLRVLLVQEDVADRLVELIAGAMETLRLGDPGRFETDIGPVIHAPARDRLLAHVEEARAYGREAFDAARLALPAEGAYFAPRLIEIDRLDRLREEVFGPVLHVVRWKAGELEGVVEAINGLGYGLTLALQTRLTAHVALVERLARVGNLYVNRSQVGAVVGSQPFGGERLSGTGPKAGGPHYLPRFMSERVTTVNTAATGGNIGLMRGDG